MKMGTCADCGQPMHRGTTSLPQGEARCRDCRRAQPPEQRTPCVDCGTPSWGERCRPCQAKHQTVRAADDHRIVRHQRERIAPGIRPRERTRLLAKWKRQGRCCTYCPSPADTIDHVVPLVRGGTNYEGNLVPACRRCNGSKWAYTVMEWRHGRRARRMAKAPEWKRKPQPIAAITGEQSEMFQVCVCGTAHIGRGVYCSQRCRARTAYRIKVGIPLNAAPYEVRACA